MCELSTITEAELSCDDGDGLLDGDGDQITLLGQMLEMRLGMAWKLVGIVVLFKVVDRSCLDLHKEEGRQADVVVEWEASEPIKSRHWLVVWCEKSRYSLSR